MKKLLLTLIVSIAFCGSIFAQYESHWSDFNSGPYEMPDAVVAFVQIDGEYVTFEGNWADLEVGAFVGDQVRGHAFMVAYEEDGDPYPIVEIDVYHMLEQSDLNQPVSFKLYNHAAQTEYDVCTSNIEILTGADHTELYFDYDNCVVLSFSMSAAEGYTKDIVGYGENEGGYYLLATPVEGAHPAEIAGMTDGAFDLYYFNQSADLEWKNFKNEAFGLVFGKGYLYAHDTDVTLTFTGTPYSGDGVFPLDYDADAEMAGYNLVGNPFLEEAYVDLPFYVMNEAGAEVVPAEGSTVPAMEGCFVLATGEEQSVTFSTEDPDSKVSLLSLNLVNGTGLVDRAIVRFGEGIQLPKFQINSSSTKLYIPMDGSDYALVSSEEMGELPVNFKAGKSGSYTLAVTSEEVSFGYLHLIDNLTGADVDLLANPTYSFEANTTDYASRFTLVFATGNADDTFAFYSNGSFVINNEGEAALQVVDVTGRILSSETINGCANVSVDGAAGVYMIRLVNGENVKVQKVVVK